MCTVSFIPVGDRVFLTSNRDEQTIRKTAEAPAPFSGSEGKLVFPKDGAAGGTWIAMDNHGRAMVLLNGANLKHAHRPPYRKSRGLIFLDLFDSPDVIAAVNTIDLENIEPFTLVYFDSIGNRLRDLRWDGQNKSAAELPTSSPHLWSSVTLYDEEVRSRRQRWFSDWLREQPSPDQDDILKFHESAGEGDETTDLVMRRGGILRTLSITSVKLSPNKSSMYYKDLLTGNRSLNELMFTPQANSL